jgi:hypothetical protein
VVFRLFPYTFENKESSSYFNIPPSYITSWDDFERISLENWGRENSHGPIQRIGSYKMEKKEKVKDSNQHFTIVLNKFSNEAAPLEPLSIKYYPLALIPSIGMFDK